MVNIHKSDVISINRVWSCSTKSTHTFEGTYCCEFYSEQKFIWECRLIKMQSWSYAYSSPESYTQSKKKGNLWKWSTKYLTCFNNVLKSVRGLLNCTLYNGLQSIFPASSMIARYAYRIRINPCFIGQQIRRWIRLLGPDESDVLITRVGAKERASSKSVWCVSSTLVEFRQGGGVWRLHATISL